MANSFGYGKLANFLAPINAELMAILQEGTWSEWTKTWSSDRTLLQSQNILSGTLYKGGNTLMCGYWQRRRGYSNNIWATRKQLEANGYYVKPNDEKFNGFISLFSPNIRQEEDKETGKKKSKMVGVKAFTVVNFDSSLIGETPYATMSVAERINEWQRANKPVLRSENQVITAGQEILDKYRQRFSIDVIPGEPAYSPGLDKILMPTLEQFSSSAAYYATYGHECIHSTGHESRLDRLKSTHFGSPEYAYEELIAELGAVYFCAHVGLEYNLEHHASYLGSWLKGLQSDVGYFVKAANAAQKAMEYVLQHSTVTDKELISA